MNWEEKKDRCSFLGVLGWFWLTKNPFPEVLREKSKCIFIALNDSVILFALFFILRDSLISHCPFSGTHFCGKHFEKLIIVKECDFYEEYSVFRLKKKLKIV